VPGRLKVVVFVASNFSMFSVSPPVYFEVHVCRTECMLLIVTSECLNELIPIATKMLAIFKL